MKNWNVKSGFCLEQVISCVVYLSINQVSQFSSSGVTWLNSNPEGQGTMRSNVRCVTYTQLQQFRYTTGKKNNHWNSSCQTLVQHSATFTSFTLASAGFSVSEYISFTNYYQYSNRRAGIQHEQEIQKFINDFSQNKLKHQRDQGVDRRIILKLIIKLREGDN